MHDFVIRGAAVIDGTETPRYTADVAVTDGAIAAIGADVGAAHRVIDADGLVLTPGFIDMHAHSDLQVLLNPAHPSWITQGVTCEVIGQDGLSYAPVTDETLAAVRKQIAGWNTDPDDFDFSWRTVGEYLDRLDEAGTATNLAYLVPHGLLRALTRGFDDGVATPSEVVRMQEILTQGLREGAVGLSTGLTYTPAMYADGAELDALLRTTARHGGYFSPHHRRYGAGAMDAYREMIDLSLATGCPLHLAHATLNFGPNKGRGPELLELLDAAIADGADISLDTYPYLPGATTLSAILPSWVAAGGTDAVLGRLRDPEALVRIREHLEHSGSDGCHGVTAEWDTIEISGVGNPRLAGYVGCTISRIATAEGRDPFDVCVGILLDDRLATGILQHVGHEENVRAIMRHRTHTGGSDGLLVGAKPHPRGWGTFARYLGHYSRDLGLMSLEECVGHLTGRAARRLKLVRRGLIREGFAADLALFDPDTVIDRATYESPRTPAAGFSHVFVRGVLALDDGALTGARAGGALRLTDEGVL
ncbi:Amidohydrolase 3 OS=Tsukamurella paurometabola (strain ATCC 8368 / DSM / CCUG 35730 / CIP 100753/ JCM 10117 / KCTC 9821 / NBRC 16120 / NCIMB 702349 / NCTC 13040) OX=521096 GN=Tpau_3006 PE=4 SV=1 [Tsukamurella paurometabola]|uniref:Amidohydrolase 3 n=1 Tax=Tsukamurella paurometabola (strain ATCC 8368 / DSM 20162 / CCUG 35730 / CIP 100753 / JCM 10117 / KCTC 9821 / NBRC 16120 / NCIMB 702349 / NCTC 13040) TaxID=521096 RepID=D5UU98_TSUPD|nr:D-aminoacylase [Tsukamurella paurometabola]ADG79601.1 Amidohydrolase 3 [Tsukamurella paurometabola DSM 20162]SUP36396.1 D-aminoacylase [Tsukamurella paurometabola]